MAVLITDYRFEVDESGCSPGMGRYILLVTIPDDISGVLPYLNAILEDTRYDHENRILIGNDDGKRYAFRPSEIRVAGINDVAEFPQVASDIVERVNRVWSQRETLTPSFRERRLPAVAGIYWFLPKTNCKQCGYTTCLVFAAELQQQPELISGCPPLSLPENADRLVQLEKLFSSG